MAVLHVRESGISKRLMIFVNYKGSGVSLHSFKSCPGTGSINDHDFFDKLLRATVRKYRPSRGKSWKIDFLHFLSIIALGRYVIWCKLFSQKTFFFEKSKNICFRGRSLKMAVFSTRSLLTSTLLALANKVARRNLDTFHKQNNSSSFTRRYFQNNIKTPWTNKFKNEEQVFTVTKTLL